MQNMNYRVCTRCVMDTSATGITIEEQVICSYCTRFLYDSTAVLKIDPVEQEKKLNVLVDAIKQEGRSKKYDCIIGVSGGIDSSWALVKAVQLGLRPLAVHMDNGWNSELAQNNIANLLRGLGVDLYTHVIDWKEYKGLMQAFFDADVIDVELLYDNAMFAVNYRKAAEYGIKYIMSGMNTTSEGMPMPADWNWHKFDRKNIVEIAKRFGGIRLNTFPAIGTMEYVKNKYIKHIQWVPFLDYFQYNKIEAMQTLAAEYGYKPYPYKHYESIFTRFYQGYLLPEKFGVDKRRVHLGSLVIAGQMTRETALADLEKLPYPSEKDLEEDRRYFLKKMGWTEQDLKNYLDRPIVAHTAYPSEKGLWNFILISKNDRVVYNFFKKIYKRIRQMTNKVKKHSDFTTLNKAQ